MSFDKKVMLNLLQEALPEIKLVYLFGSKATGADTHQSDIDLAVLTSQKIDNVLRWKLGEKLARYFKQDVDLVDLRQASPVIRMQIVNQGDCLFAKSTFEKDWFEMQTISMYIDVNEMRQPIIEAMYPQVKQNGAQDDVLLNKAETIRRCLQRIQEEYKSADNFERNISAQCVN